MTVVDLAECINDGSCVGVVDLAINGASSVVLTGVGGGGRSCMRNDENEELEGTQCYLKVVKATATSKVGNKGFQFNNRSQAALDPVRT